ncbi:MAG: PAS/GGDEF/EAL domain-containing protein [Gammaproteobacteria bacterium]|nr:MAG: PAS/GGDEF/EAL domain-containing protein [Gammaproteobacteria bacterium]TND03252.1 MAG: PAS/GGDEF/EAL domain-containing protein [Gammaproteobacteria bacterium]
MNIAAPADSYSQITGKDVRILLVNDDTDTRVLLRRILLRAGFINLIEADSGHSAVRLLRSDKVNFLITDIHMPDLDGWRLARMVRSGVFRCPSDIPIIAVSATYRDRIAESTAREHEINYFLSLPFENHDVLLDAVRRCDRYAKPSRKPTLLIVEDDDDTAMLAERVLQRRFDTEIARDGNAGLEAWRMRRHNLVLLDVMLPGMAGPEVLENILAEKPSQSVVIMTADGTMDRSEALMLDGATDFIAKPFKADHLRQTCEIAVRRADYMTINHEFLERVAAQRTSEDNYQKLSRLHDHMLDNLGSVVFKLDGTGQLRFLNRAWENISHYKIADSLNMPFLGFLHPEEHRRFQSVLKLMASGGVSRYKQEVRLINSSGEPVWVEISMDARKDEQNDLEAIYGHLIDISEQKIARRQLEHLAMHDVVTGLFNRRYFEISLEQLAASSMRGGTKHALLYIDLDHFKIVNDNLSHRDGDIVLKEISEILVNRTREADLLCRIGGDEFAMLLMNTHKTQATALAQDILDRLRNYHYGRDGLQFSVSCSIGVSIIDGALPSAAEYLVQADKASFVAKNRGRSRVHAYDPEDTEADDLWQSVDWANRLREAIADNRLDIFVQPIVDLETREINHYEALLRLFLPESGGIVLPDVFIPAVERAGHIHTLDRWVVDRALSTLATNPHIGNLAINLSGHAFEDPDLMSLIKDSLGKYGVLPTRVIFEITETASVSNIGNTRRMINQLRSLGCRFALDDFGAGFCSFNYLKHLPADYIKLDGSYIKNIVTDDLDMAMVRSMNDIAHVLGKKTIAECVEDAPALDILRHIGVDYVQGFSVGRPTPVAMLGIAGDARTFSAGVP